MNIPITNIAKATEKGLTIEDYVILLIENDGCNYLFNSYSLNSTQLLIEGYIKGNGGITEKGKELLKSKAEENMKYLPPYPITCFLPILAFKASPNLI